LSDYCVELFPLLKCPEERERFAVSCYGSLQTVERRRIFRCSASRYLGVRRQFEHSFYGLTCMTRTRLPHGPDLLLRVAQLQHVQDRAGNVISRAVSNSQRKPDAFIEMGFANPAKVSKYARPVGMRAPSEGGQRRAGSVECSLSQKKGKTEKSLVVRGFSGIHGIESTGTEQLAE